MKNLIIGRGLKIETNVHFLFMLVQHIIICVRQVKDLIIPFQHIGKVMHAKLEEKLQKHNLGIVTLIKNIRCLGFGGCTFKGLDEPWKFSTITKVCDRFESIY